MTALYNKRKNSEIKERGIKMSELTEIIRKVNLKNIISYLLYDAGASMENLESCGEKIEKSFDEFFDKLERLYSETDRNNDQLFEIVSEFALLHDNVYFETGIIIGFELYKTLERSYENHKEGEIEKILQISNNLEQEKADMGIMRKIVQERMDTALEDSLKEDREFKELNENIRKKLRKLDKNRFTATQWEIIDDILSASNERSSEYGRMAYQQGLLDTLNFMKEVLIET